MDHTDEVGVGAGKKQFTDVEWEWFGFISRGSSDDRGDSLVVFGDCTVGHSAKSWVENGLFAACEVLLNSGVRDISHKRFLEPFRQDGKHTLEVVFMDACCPTLGQKFQPG